MRKFQMLLVLSIFSLAVFAQPKDVTKFLGIPVDGTKAEMTKKLLEKGFEFSADGVLEGEFNGEEVRVHIVTDNRKVWRIAVFDKTPRGETQIRLRFNKLCRQFENNDKYSSSSESQTISDDEDISYEISVNDKQYEASFYQDGGEYLLYMDSLNLILREYALGDDSVGDITENSKLDSLSLRNEYYANRMGACIAGRAQKSVWFRISEFMGKYYICMYYDNEYNRADGSEL